MGKPAGIDARAATFFDDVVVFVKTVPPQPGNRRVIDQLVAAAGSIDANRNEATSATTRREFIRYNELALRSAKESAVWLRGCEKGCWGDEQSRRRLLDEARQIARILGAIVINSKKRGEGSVPLDLNLRPRPLTLRPTL